MALITKQQSLERHKVLLLTLAKNLTNKQEMLTAKMIHEQFHISNIYVLNTLVKLKLIQRYGHKAPHNYMWVCTKQVDDKLVEQVWATAAEEKYQSNSKNPNFKPPKYQVQRSKVVLREVKKTRAQLVAEERGEGDRISGPVIVQRPEVGQRPYKRGRSQVIASICEAMQYLKMSLNGDEYTPLSFNEIVKTFSVNHELAFVLDAMKVIEVTKRKVNAYQYGYKWLKPDLNINLAYAEKVWAKITNYKDSRVVKLHGKKAGRKGIRSPRPLYNNKFGKNTIIPEEKPIQPIIAPKAIYVSREVTVSRIESKVLTSVFNIENLLFMKQYALPHQFDVTINRNITINQVKDLIFTVCDGGLKLTALDEASGNGPHYILLYDRNYRFSIDELNRQLIIQAHE